MADEPSYNRRHFLKDSVRSFARTAHEYVTHRDAPAEKPEPATRTDWLRPPGAVSESLFLERCTRCGDCAKACPYESIKFDIRNGTPVIFPDEIPCYLCDDFPCIGACATDALISPASRDAVKMGEARVSLRSCTAEQGCHACVSKCPTDALSMDFETLRLVVSDQRCVGCGLCEYTCRTVNDVIAIRVLPVRHVATGESPG
jgi:ferredoxin-type protein NapG